MKNRKLWFILITVLLMSALILTGCGGDEEEPTPAPAATEAVAEQAAQPTEPPAEVEEVEETTAEPEVTDPWADVDPSGQTVTFWHQHSRDREEALNEIIADFNANRTVDILRKCVSLGLNNIEKRLTEFGLTETMKTLLNEKSVKKRRKLQRDSSFMLAA